MKQVRFMQARSLWLIWLLFVLVPITACQSPIAALNPTPTPIEDDCETPPDAEICAPTALLGESNPGESNMTVFAPLVGAGNGSLIAGQVLWGAQPVADAQVELRSGAWASAEADVILKTVSDENGEFVLTNAPQGEFGLVARWPDGGVNRAAVTPVLLEENTRLEDVSVRLARDLALTEPLPDATVTSMPLLRWTAFDHAVSYRVLIIDAGTTEVIIDTTSDTNEMTMESPLPSGRTYLWLVQVVDDQEILLAEGQGAFATEDQ